MTEKELQKIMADLETLEQEEKYETSRLSNEYIQTTSTRHESSTSSTPTCWGTLPDEEFTPAFKSVDKVPAGIYEIVWNRSLSQHTIKKQPFKTDELYQLPSYEIQDILKDIQNTGRGKNMLLHIAKIFTPLYHPEPTLNLNFQGFDSHIKHCEMLSGHSSQYHPQDTVAPPDDIL